MNLTNAPTANTPKTPEEKKPEEKKPVPAYSGKDYINSMFDASLQSQKNQLQQGYDQGKADLDQAQRESQIRRDADLNRTYVEAAKDRKNYHEVENAYGLTSGAMAQARLAQDNAAEKGLTLLRLQGEERDRQIDKERNLLGQKFQAAIAKAQADNDMGRAQALYKEAQRAEDLLRQQQMQGGQLMAGIGDFEILGEALGLSPEQIEALTKDWKDKHPTGGGGGGGGYGGGYYRRPSAAGGSDEGASGSGGSPWYKDVNYYDRVSNLHGAIGAAGGKGAAHDQNSLLTGAVNNGNITPQQAVEIAKRGRK